MAATHDHETTTAAARESDQFLNLRDRLRAYVELWSREEGLGPGVVEVVGRGAEGNRGVELGQLALDGVHFFLYAEYQQFIMIVCTRNRYNQCTDVRVRSG